MIALSFMSERLGVDGKSVDFGGSVCDPSTLCFFLDMVKEQVQKSGLNILQQTTCNCSVFLLNHPAIRK